MISPLYFLIKIYLFLSILENVTKRNVKIAKKGRKQVLL